MGVTQRLWREEGKGKGKGKVLRLIKELMRDRVFVERLPNGTLELRDEHDDSRYQPYLQDSFRLFLK